MGEAADAGTVPGAAMVIARRGKVVHADAQGISGIERRNPLGLNAIYRMYSQTKPVCHGPCPGGLEAALRFTALLRNGKERSCHFAESVSITGSC